MVQELSCTIVIYMDIFMQKVDMFFAVFSTYI